MVSGWRRLSDYVLGLVFLYIVCHMYSVCVCVTSERLRFDFSFGRKVTKEELERVEDIVNEAIRKKIDVILEEMTPERAYEEGAVGVFSKKYGEMVKVFTIPGYSKEICGGPHARNTGELVSFKIIKEEASSAGVRRIKAVINAQ